MEGGAGNYRHIGVKPMDAALGAEILGVDLRQDVSAEVFKEIHAAHLQYGVIVFRGQSITPGQQKAFTSRFGELTGHLVKRFHHPEHPEVIVFTNVTNGTGKTVGADRGGLIWHSDHSFKAEPSLGSMLYGVECPPEGANTEFASMYAAYDALPEQKKREIETLRGVHDYAWHWETYLSHRPPLTVEEKAKVPPVSHPLVRTHPETKRKALYVTEGITRYIEGMDPDAGRQLILELARFSTQPQFVYSHAWQARDLVFWDNRCTVHRATEFDSKYTRRMHRTTIKGDAPF